MSPLTLLSIHGAALEPYLQGLGELRIGVFRDFPYLYDGSLDYEQDYLRTYMKAERSAVLLVLAGERVVGATTCIPLVDEGPEFQAPFLERGFAVEEVCYFGESILLPEYRGRGLGRTFFEHREAHAKKLGARITAFCAVDRAEDHPMRPADYPPLDGLWTKMGYTRQPGMQAVFRWKEIGESCESPKTLTFWLKHWR